MIPAAAFCLPDLPANVSDNPHVSLGILDPVITHTNRGENRHEKVDARQYQSYTWFEYPKVDITHFEPADRLHADGLYFGT